MELGFFKRFFVVVEIFETLDMSYKQLGEMFERDYADTCARKFPLTSMGG